MPRPAGFDLNPDAFDDLLERAGITKTDLALQAEVSLGTIRDLQIGRRGASLKVVHSLSGALRCRPGTLFPALAQRHQVAAAAG